jgi:molybdopterin/thiamine biosynthesis adenylyltransferase
MEYFVKFPEGLWADLQRSLWLRPDVETAGAILVHAISTEGATALVARETRIPDESDYRDRRSDFLELSPSWINRCCADARALGAGVLTVHTHLHSGRPAFSWADDRGDARLMPAMVARLAPRAVGSMVVSQDDAVVRVIAGDNLVPARLTVVGKGLSVFPRPLPAASEAHSRQVLAIGAHGQAMLADLRVGLVGLGGTGSVVHMLLRHLGVRTIVAVEPDHLENSNRSRIVGSRVSDDAGAVSKMAIAERLGRDIQGDETILAAIPRPLSDEQDARGLVSCDLVFSCVDRLLPRALLNDLAYAAQVPMIDMGSAFRVDAGGRIVSQGGKVAVIGPGRPCLWCWGDLDSDRLRAETLPPDERRALAAEGYVEGAAAPQPAVVAFNATVASAAVIEAMRLVTHFAGAGDPPDRLNFDFARGTVTRVRGRSREGCQYCGRSPDVALLPPAVLPSPIG